MPQNSHKTSFLYGDLFIRRDTNFMLSRFSFSLLSFVVGYLIGFGCAVGYYEFRLHSSIRISERNECISCLRLIDSGKAAVAQKKGLKQGDVIDLESLAKEHAWPYRCPSGGKYSINRVGENPTCSIPNHKLSEFSP
jgi:predicted RNA-binding Zn-ribbon protein involved in translation (DUF1610 family)